MTAPNAAWSDAFRHIREIALRDAMAMCNRMKPDPGADLGNGLPSSVFRSGHLQARMQLYAELERMIAREAAPVTVQPGYTSDGLEDS